MLVWDMRVVPIVLRTEKKKKEMETFLLCDLSLPDITGTNIIFNPTLISSV